MSDEELIRKLEVVESQIGDFNEFEDGDSLIPLFTSSLTPPIPKRSL